MVMVKVANMGKAVMVMKMETAMMSEGSQGNSDTDEGRDSGGNRGA